ncbi:hypothetical protein [Sphingobacterium faecium]
MKKIIKKISRVVQVILLAPVKLPGKVLNIIKYIGLGLGIIESVIADEDDKKDVEGKSLELENAGFISKSSAPDGTADPALESSNTQKSLVRYDLETGEEMLDEIE